MGVYGEILYPLSDLNESSHQSCLKPSNDRGEFELDQAKSKNNIAKKSVALGHDTHNRPLYCHCISCISRGSILSCLVYRMCIESG